jgi:hypothetical protein
MVTAGVYLVVRCNGIYQNAPTAMFIVAIVGAATAIFAATIGLAQNESKKFSLNQLFRSSVICFSPAESARSSRRFSTL